MSDADTITLEYHIQMVREAFIEGWSDGHNEGIGCGHALAPRCRHSAKAEWLDSEAREILSEGNTDG